MTSAIIADATASPLVTEQKSYNPNLRKLIWGAGRNDFPGPTRIAGVDRKSYGVWKGMLERCLSSAYQTAHPTYRDCCVVEEWLSFSVFEQRYTEHHVEGFSLDKDILIPGNKVYGPATCVLISQALNTLLTDKSGTRGPYPLGVTACRDKFKAAIFVNCLNIHLGVFLTPLEAHKAWQLAKAFIIEQFPTNDPRIRAALDLRVKQLRDDHANNRITTKL